MFTNGVTWDSFLNEETDLITPVGAGESEYIDMEVTIVPDWNTSVQIDWVHPKEDVPAHDGAMFMVYSSESEAGPFTNLTVQPQSDTTFITYHQIGDSKVYEQYFTVEIIYPDGKVFRSYPKAPENNLPKWQLLRYKDIIRRESILLEKFVGVPSIIYTPRRSGLRCRSCWDVTHKKVMNDHCENCLGTGYDGGYDVGLKTLIQYTPIDKQSAQSYQGRVEMNTIQGWTVPIPAIVPHAIVLRTSDMKAFRCEGSQGTTEIMTVNQKQSVVLRELGKDSIEYQLFDRDDAITIMPRPKHVHHQRSDYDAVDGEASEQEEGSSSEAEES